MSFSDNDPIEQEMGVRCEDMDPGQLVTYIKTYHHAYGRELAVDGVRERAVFKGLQHRYGPKTAGNIVKWVFYHHKGRWNDKWVGFFSFSKGSKWWTDMMHMEYQDALDKEKPKTASRVAVGSQRLSDL